MTTPASEQPVEDAGRPEIEFVMLAERAEILNGKLYMMGGGYDRLILDQPPPQVAVVTFAIGLLLPPEASGRRHQLQFAVLDAAGNAVAASEQIVLTFVRPPTLGAGESQRVLLAPLGGPVQFPSYGRYVLQVALDGVAHKTVALSIAAPEPG